MTLENLKAKQKYLIAVIGGSAETKNPVRNELIISDAKRNLAELIKKFPELEVKEEKPEVKAKK